MSDKQQNMIEIHGIITIHEANPDDTHFVLPNPSNITLTPYLQMLYG